MSGDEDLATQGEAPIGDERVAGASRRHQSGQSKARQRPRPGPAAVTKPASKARQSGSPSEQPSWPGP